MRTTSLRLIPPKPRPCAPQVRDTVITISLRLVNRWRAAHKEDDSAPPPAAPADSGTSVDMKVEVTRPAAAKRLPGGAGWVGVFWKAGDWVLCPTQPPTRGGPGRQQLPSASAASCAPHAAASAAASWGCSGQLPCSYCLPPCTMQAASSRAASWGRSWAHGMRRARPSPTQPLSHRATPSSWQVGARGTAATADWARPPQPRQQRHHHGHSAAANPTPPSCLGPRTCLQAARPSPPLRASPSACCPAATAPAPPRPALQVPTPHQAP